MPNSWGLLYFKAFDEQIDELTNEVIHLREIDPDNYKSHPKNKTFSKNRHQYLKTSSYKSA